jgi:hypothetical protein
VILFYSSRGKKGQGDKYKRYTFSPPHNGLFQEEISQDPRIKEVEYHRQ